MLDRSIIEWSGPGADTAHDWWGSFTFPRIFQSSCALSGHPIINADKINFKISYNNVFSSADFQELENACTMYIQLQTFGKLLNFWRGARQLHMSEYLSSYHDMSTAIYWQIDTYSWRQ